MPKKKRGRLASSPRRIGPGGLTQRQEDFCLAYIECGGKANEAYRRAYSTEAMKPETVNSKAYRLMLDARIADRIASLREKAANAAALTLAEHLDDLKALREEAREKGMLSAAVTAEIARGKAAGLYVERQQVEASITNAEPVRVVFEYPDNGRMATEGAEQK